MYIQFSAERMLVEAWGWGYLPCLLAVLVLCSVTLTWDAPLFAPYREHYVSKAHYHGVDVFTEALHSPVGPEQFMEHFYVCYGRDGRKTYFKKQDQNYFSNRRYWVISSSDHLASDELVVITGSDNKMAAVTSHEHKRQQLKDGH
ncbi:unnamed protein product [Pocillopora meandrina]|uniref:Uncharacterized protein n=1 Tax=Pocillopora meandrina TaxID=46732 RepID=A0AAU9XF34_9CNID|nr:unnamed protein product [Pocillopora meandrina]